MKILMVIPYFAPAWSYGGPVKVMSDLAKAASEKDCSISVLTTDVFDGSKRNIKLSEKIGLVEVVRQKNVSNYLAKNFNLYTPIGYKKFLKNNLKNFDLLHLNAFFTYQNIVASRLCLKNKVPYILHLHESPIPTKEGGRRLVKNIFNHIWGKKILLSANRILVLTNREKSSLMQFLPETREKIVVLPNGIKLNTKENPSKRNGGNKVILSLSRLSYIKGIDLLIKAFAQLLKRDQGYRLVIAGADERGEKARLVKLAGKLQIADKVKFVGEVTGNKKDEIYQNSDIYALFSKYDAFGLTVLEALAHNLPVCLSRQVGISQVIAELQCGLIVDDCQNSEEASKLLQETYEKRNFLQVNCFEALKKFGFEKTVNDLIEIYSELVGAK